MSFLVKNVLSKTFNKKFSCYSVDLDSQEHGLIQLARKLGLTRDVGDTYMMHVWLLKELMEILAKNIESLPAQFKE